MNCLIKPFILSVFTLVAYSSVFSQTDTINFSPPAVPPTIHAVEAKENIIIDGKLNEEIWKTAPVTTNFFRMEPRQGGNYLYPTYVQAVYDKKNLYFGVFCKDSTGKKDIRVQDYRRDFAFGNNDEFSISLDPQNLKRYCVSFHATPLATQGDLQVFNDTHKDQDWDALWKVKSNMTDSGYYLEFAIPFNSLRYDKVNSSDSATSWGITYSRFVVRNYEQTVFPAIPQSLSPYRMTYAARLKGLQLPSPALNLRVQPYVLYQYDRTKANNIIADKSIAKAGGEIKWAINPHAVLDATINTDFAQADADVAVNNLTRFNIFFPEKRQFFLENSGVFASAGNSWIRPYFSRTIGLENTQYNANPVPIDGGARFTDRNSKRTIAALYVHQRETVNQAPVNFSVLRYLKSYGEQNNIGVMLTHKLEEANGSKFLQRDNTTATIDGLIRPNNKWTVDYFASLSRENGNDSIGFAGKIYIAYRSNKMYVFYRSNIIGEKYLPGMGYVYQTNVMMQNPGGYYIWQPTGNLSKLIRRWEPGFFFTSYQNASYGKLQSAGFDISPIWVYFKNNSMLTLDVLPTWEQYYFTPLGIQVKPGRYFYTQCSTSVSTDASRKLSAVIAYQFGNYYDGRKSQLNISARIAPNPHIAFTGSYENISIRNLGIYKTDVNYILTTAGARIALNPQIQASVFYQYNSYNKQGRWNVRGSWEIAPLSFLYLVFNDNSFQATGNDNQSFICKISYLKQF